MVFKTLFCRFLWSCWCLLLIDWFIGEHFTQQVGNRVKYPICNRNDAFLLAAGGKRKYTYYIHVSIWNRTCCNECKGYLFIIWFRKFLNYVSVLSFLVAFFIGALLPFIDGSKGIEAAVPEGVDRHGIFLLGLAGHHNPSGRNCIHTGCMELQIGYW